ncbi:MAG: ABC transporter permease, partial [Acidobacteriota bacterium]|nr:ABC transporter permease [Acidobacteriota bacterium]
MAADGIHAEASAWPAATSGVDARPRRRVWSPSMAREIVREAMHGLFQHRTRALLSMLGISWGIVSVVMLLAYGNGFHGALV